MWRDLGGFAAAAPSAAPGSIPPARQGHNMSSSGTDNLTHHIAGLVMPVHTRLGPCLLENTDDRCLCHPFDQHGIAYPSPAIRPASFTLLPPVI